MQVSVKPLVNSKIKCSFFFSQSERTFCLYVLSWQSTYGIPEAESTLEYMNLE